MAKSSPEKLAQALRANLKRRKQGSLSQDGEKPAKPAAQAPEKPAKNSG